MQVKNKVVEEVYLQRPVKESNKIKQALVFNLILIVVLSGVLYWSFSLLSSEPPENITELILLFSLGAGLVFCVPFVLIFIQYRLICKSHLRLSAQSIHYHSGLPKFLQGIFNAPQFPSRDWKIDWAELKKLQLKPSDLSRYRPGAEFIQLLLHQQSKKSQAIALFPYQWVDATQATAKRSLSWLEKLGIRLKPPSEAEVSKAVLLSPIMRFIALHQLPRQHGFQLEIEKQLVTRSSSQRVLIYVLLGAVSVLSLVTLYQTLPFGLFAGGETVEAPPEVKARYTLPTAQRHQLSGHRSNVLPVVFSPDGQIVASGSKDKSIQLWNVETGQSIRTLTGHSDKVQSLAFSPDQQWLASGSEDNSIRLWQISDGKLLKKINNPHHGRHKGFYSLAFHPQGHWLAAANWDGHISLWSIPDGQLLQTLERHTNSVNGITFNAEGSLLASAGFDSVIHLWQVEGEKLTWLRTFEGHKDWVLGVAFSPDGQQLASSSFDKSVRLWNLHSGELLHTLYGHKDSVRDVAFHPDGNWLVSCSFDRSLKFWEVQSGFLLHDLQAHTDYINHLAFSPDGNYLATASGDDSVKIWHVPQSPP